MTPKEYDILETVQEAERKLEHIEMVMAHTMCEIEGRDPNGEMEQRAYHLLGVLCEGVRNVQVMLGEIGTGVLRG